MTNLILLPAFIILWFLIPWLFVFIFGQEWLMAGTFAQILLPLIYLKFLSNSFTSAVYLQYQKQGENFVLSILITLSLLFSFYYAHLVNSIETGLWLLVLSNSVIIIIKIFRVFGFIKKGCADATDL